MSERTRDEEMERARAKRKPKKPEKAPQPETGKVKAPADTTPPKDQPPKPAKAN